MKTLSVLLTFGLLIAANALAARMARVNALPARKTALAQQSMHPTNFVPAKLPTSNVSHRTNLYEEKL